MKMQKTILAGFLIILRINKWKFLLNIFLLQESSAQYCQYEKFLSRGGFVRICSNIDNMICHSSNFESFLV